MIEDDLRGRQEEEGEDEGVPIRFDGRCRGREGEPRCAVRFLPCRVHRDGPAPVSKYLMERELMEGEDRDAGGRSGVVSSFRGRKLLGQDVKVPSGCKGLILREEGGAWQVEDTFDRITVYDHDRMPSKPNPILASIEWLELAGAIHDP